MRRDLFLAILAGLIAGVVYGLSSAPGILFGDGGELQFAAWTAGLPHPTGYPLYMALGWAWSHLLDAIGLASPARAMTLLSVLFAAVAVGLTYLFAHAFIDSCIPRTPPGLQSLASLLAALTFAFTPTFWSQAVTTEVYTLHAAFVASMLWLAVRWGSKVDGGGWRVEGKARLDPLLAALALTFGLSLAHHRTTLLLAPFLLGYLAWQAPSGYWRHNRRTIVWLILLALVPLLLYAYVPLRAAATPYLTIELQPGQPVSLLDRSPAGLVSYLLGQGFAGELQAWPEALAATPGLAGRFLAELTPVGVGLALLGLAVLVARRCWSVLWLTGGSFLALVAFNLAYTIGDIAVFYIPCYLIACGWIGVAAAWLAGWVGSRLGVLPGSSDRSPSFGSQTRAPDAPARRILPILVTIALFALPATLVVSQYSSLDRSRDTRAQDWWDALLAADPPQGSLLVSNDRDEMMPLWYLQQVEGVRPDLLGVFPLLLAEDGWRTLGQAVDSALATGRPVSLIKPMPGLEIKAQLGPAGPSGLTPVLGPAITGSPARRQDILLGDAVRLAGDTIDPQAVRPGQSVTVDLYWQPVRALPANVTSFVQMLLPDGNKVAQSDHLAGGVYYPSSQWQSGETLLDRHVLSIPADAPPGPYQVLVGLYELVDGEARMIGSTTLTSATVCATMDAHRPPSLLKCFGLPDA